MHRMNPLRWAVGIVATAVFLGGCAQPQLNSAAAAPAAREPAVIRQQLESLYAATWGTHRARQAVEVLAYVEFQEHVAGCLQANGWAHVPGAFIDAVPSATSVSWWPALLPIDQKAAAEQGFGPPATVHQVTPGKQWPGRTPPPAVQAACEKSAGIPVDLPALDPQLDRALYTLTGDVVSATPSASPKSYATCMQVAGFAVGDSRESFVGALINQRTASGQLAAESERRAAVADSACRSTAHLDVMAKLDVTLAEFEQRNHDQLAALADQPDQLQTQAMAAAQRIDLAITWI